MKKEILEFLSKHNISAKKRYGQNFLADSFVVQKIINAANICEDDTIIEIGPGLGVLTKELAKKAKKVVAIEIDTTLIEPLKSQLSEFNNVEIINQDFLKVDLKSLTYGENVKIIANLPYYITTPIIFHILESGISFQNMIFMVQKEVANRILAKEATKDYGLLTLSVAFYAKCWLVANVPPNAFIPRPDVHSAVVCFEPIDAPNVPKNAFFAITKAAFSTRRKTLQNCLVAYLNLDKSLAEKIIIEAGLPPQIRGEALNFKEFEKIACIYSEYVI